MQWMRSIGSKIIVPYTVLTLVIAAIGAFIVTNLVTGSLSERFQNQLLDAGRIVAESMVDEEESRLAVLRIIANTDGVAAAISSNQRDALANLVPQIVANSSMDAVHLLNTEGVEVFGWQRTQISNETELRSGANFADFAPVQQTLRGEDDGLGNKRTFIAQNSSGYTVFTIGPVQQDGVVVGAVMVGMELQQLVEKLAQNSVAKVTLYLPNGSVLATTFAENYPALQEPDAQYAEIRQLLSQDTAENYVVVANSDSQVPLQQVEVHNQQYQLAYGDWRLRNTSFGLFSVALPSNFIVNTTATSRNQLSAVFSLAAVSVFALGYIIARRIVIPVNRLVEVSTAVTQGDLNQRSGIDSKDEIGVLANTFDTMTDHLAARNRQLQEQASNLQAILHSIADAVIVLNNDNKIIATNPAGQALLDRYYYADGSAESKETIKTIFNAEALPPNLPKPQYQIGEQVFSAVTSTVKTPAGKQLNRVIVLRDVTREAEAESLKDGFITNISHELRTPLTSIKGYIELLSMTGQANLDERQRQFLEKVRSSTDTLTGHVNKLIELSEIQNGTLKLNSKPEDVGQLLAEKTAVWQGKMREKDLALTINLAEEALNISGDVQRLQWVFDNLLDNAYHYTKEGGRVSIHAYRENGDVRIDVTDSGIGISPTDQPHLFTRFFRIAHQPHFNQAGVGLGLYIVRSLVELHGGAVWANSELNQGSTFSLSFPALENHD